MRWKRFNTVLAEFRIKMGRGRGLLYEVRNAIIFGTAYKLMFDLEIPMTIVLTIAMLGVFYVIGVIDLKYIKLFQKESELSARKYNPHLKKIDEILRLLRKSVHRKL